MSATVTGRRRVAFAAYVDENYLPGFLVLLRSLALSNPTVCEDFVVLYDDLRPSSLTAIHRLHPRVRPRRIDPARYDGFVKGDPENYLVRKAYFILDVFLIRDYDTVITLDTDMVVLGDIGELLRLRTGLAAVPQFFHGPDRGPEKLNSGLLVIQREFLTDAFWARLDETGRSGKYELDKHDQGILNAVLAGDFVRLDPSYNFVKRRLSGDKSVPGKVRILHYTGRHKPWAGGERGYARAEEAWHRHDLRDHEFASRFMALPGAKHPDLVTHLGTGIVERTGDVRVAREVASAHVGAGRYQEAVDVLSRVRIPAHWAWPHEVLGSALGSVSRYEEAEAHLLLAAGDPRHAARALGRLAQLAWVRGDDGRAREYALRGLDADPLNRTCALVHRRAEPRPAEPAEGRAAGQLAHVAYFMDRQGNAGDKVLPEAVRLCFDPDPGPARWHAIHAHRLFDEAALERVNARRGLVVGGGGLFIPDTMPNGNSGWQWNVPDRMLERIRVPLAVFAVGYNAFDGQSYPARRFAESLRLLVSRSAFFGLRNHGSVERVRELLPADLRDLVRYQPCPTTVTRRLVAGWRDPEPGERADTILLNCAYDRAGLRFGHDYGHFLGELAKAVRGLGKLAEVRCVAHSLDDERIAFDLRREHGISLPVVPLYDYDVARIHAEFARTRLVIGMRGHAGMIPFGCGTPIISLISHPKMAYFLSDIGRPEWGISVHEVDLGAMLVERAAGLLANHGAAVADVLGRQEELWRVTRANVERLAEVFGGPAA
ncbi:glycosyltransferase [Streptomyces sp. 8K308]|uniref:glycosyltransferase n=1 Tax=Streptomyces sp. 8K308 TaxID=2530388 RepID=UPI001FB7E46C|nr:glycosyltransferase [Streptomyces sp. 8K308]